ncbi:hypothetical protein SDC9_187097 [bioreactor metagenome]|uniref:Uncharacterized protein n=1 Tax=bioreactor metagenome TaxID=1076179 RepID=A0A645HMU3_9ZZZZ
MRFDRIGFKRGAGLERWERTVLGICHADCAAVNIVIEIKPHELNRLHHRHYVRFVCLDRCKEVFTVIKRLDVRDIHIIFFHQGFVEQKIFSLAGNAFVYGYCVCGGRALSRAKIGGGKNNRIHIIGNELFISLKLFVKRL